jgi:hypothetical protein
MPSSIFGLPVSVKAVWFPTPPCHEGPADVIAACGIELLELSEGTLIYNNFLVVVNLFLPHSCFLKIPFSAVVSFGSMTPPSTYGKVSRI